MPNKNKNTKIAIQEIPVEIIEDKIILIRGKRVMLDKDLAGLYEVSTKIFNQAVKRNFTRFPEDFMFQLTKNELDFLRSQIVTLEKGRGHYSKYLSYAFTEQGVAMLSSVLWGRTACSPMSVWKIIKLRFTWSVFLFAKIKKPDLIRLFYFQVLFCHFQEIYQQ